MAISANEYLYWKSIVHNFIWNDEFHPHLNKHNIRRFYEAVAQYFDLPLPSGSINIGYALKNIRYLRKEINNSEFWENGKLRVTEGWAYRIYVPFSGNAPEFETIPIHCVASYRFFELERNYDKYEPIIYENNIDSRIYRRLSLSLSLR